VGEEVREIGVTVLLRVSSRGGALYLYVPRDVADAYGILIGDKVEAKLIRIRRSGKHAREATED